MSAGVDYVFIGDDFTGASDTLATLARAGQRVRLFLDPPDPAAILEEGLNAIGIATELRSLPPDAIAEKIDALVPVLRGLSPRILHYKVCSTFDSSPETGSIGAAVTLLERHLDPAMVAILGGQPSLGRYCAFGNLFARGPDGEVHRIDRHPVMRSHPITPMAEADLRLHLASQGLQGVQLVPWPAMEDGAAALERRLERLVRAEGSRRILFDICSQACLEALGAVLTRHGSPDHPLIVVGASSVAEALGGNLRPSGAVMPRRCGNGKSGPCLVVAGSRSQVTAAQVEAARSFSRMPVRPPDLASEPAVDAFAARCAAALATGENVLVHLAPSEAYAAGGAALSRKLADLVAAILDRQAVCALGIAGGDTSSVVVQRLGFRSLAFEGQLDAGVAICVAASEIAQRDGMRLMLKGGQVGSETVFDRFVAGRFEP